MTSNIEPSLIGWFKCSPKCRLGLVTFKSKLKSPNYNYQLQLNEIQSHWDLQHGEAIQIQRQWSECLQQTLYDLGIHCEVLECISLQGASNSEANQIGQGSTNTLRAKATETKDIPFHNHEIGSSRRHWKTKIQALIQFIHRSIAHIISLRPEKFHIRVKELSS